MSLSASILRNLVSSIFNVPAHKVKLSGTIEPESTWHFDSGVSYVKGWDDAKVFGFSPKTGFENIGNVIGYTHYYNGNHNQDTTSAHTLAEASKGKDYIFYVVNTFGACHNDGERYNEFTLYKAPNFAAYWAAIEEKDIKRWEEWLNA